MFKLFPSFLLAFAACLHASPKIMTVLGPIEPGELGKTLSHEHILVDFVGAAGTGYHRWQKEAAAEAMLPYLEEVKALGVRAFVDCTPAYIGRDPALLRTLSQQSDLHIVTNTGYYGAGHNRYLPEHAHHESADQLAARWIAESEKSIEGTGVFPGFIKIGVGRGSLSKLHQKLVIAAAQTHLATGLTIASHSGPATPALEQIELLKEHGVSPSAFIWVHAHNEQDLDSHLKAARQGAWISLDGIRDKTLERILAQLQNLRENDLLDRVLLSHDAGWYSPHKAEPAADVRPFTDLFKLMIPRLKQAGFSEQELDQLLIRNPARALAIQVRKINP